MDYKYIEQLLESYFDCCTTPQEEQILRSFFSQEDVPAHLAHYADLFHYEADAKEAALSEDFDRRLLAHIEGEQHLSMPKKARIIKMATHHLTPFFKAAAVVAIALTIGQAAEHAIGEHEMEENSSPVAVDPYIKTSDVLQTIRVKDVSQAETKAVSDSILNVPSQNEVQ